MRLAVLIAATVLSGVCDPRAIAQPQPLGQGIDGYLQEAPDTWLTALAPAPAQGGPVDVADLAAVQRLQGHASGERLQQARLDQESVYPRFTQALAGPIDRNATPHLIRLLNRAEKDVRGPLREAKRVYVRERPFERLKIRPACDSQGGAAVVPGHSETDSYPSGHAASGWILALVLSRVAPERRDALRARAADYGLSRELCAMHFPSDVRAGQALAVRMMRALDASPAFRSDLECARAEHQRQSHPHVSIPSACAALTAGPPSSLES